MNALELGTLEDKQISWQVAHEALSRLARARAAADAEEGRWLLAAQRAAVHVHLGYSSFSEYVERLFGYQPRSLQERLRVAEALEGLPGFAQALSHASEPIPPPWTGSHRFMSLGEWLRSAPLARIIALALLSPTVFPLLEIWAAPRVWVLQALHLMMRAGYRPALREQLEVRVVEILDDARTGWAQPELDAA